MATISAAYTFNSGDTIGITVDIENDYPDALAEAVKTAGAMLRDVMAGVAELDDEDE